MGTLLTQLPALLGVLVGTLGTILATSLTDRARWRRGQSVRWDERRLDAYVDYAHAIKESHAIALRMTADHRPGSHSHPIDRESGLVRLAEADARRTIVWENLLLLGGSRAAIMLGEYVEQAWQLTVPALRASLSAAAGPVLLHDAAVLARYRALDRLYELVDVARGGVGGVWLLCPMEDPALLPKLDGAVVRVGDNEWIALPDAWVVNAHRSTAAAS